MSTDDKIRVELLVRTSNEIISHADTSIIRELTSESEHHLNSVNYNIVQVQQNLFRLMNNQSQGIERLSRLRVGILSHKNLPPELPAEIFVHCLVGRPVSVPPVSYLSFTPWNLSRVCSRWRTIALADPRLWTNLRMGDIKSGTQAAV